MSKYIKYTIIAIVASIFISLQNNVMAKEVIFGMNVDQNILAKQKELKEAKKVIAPNKEINTTDETENFQERKVEVVDIKNNNFEIVKEQETNKIELSQEEENLFDVADLQEEEQNENNLSAEITQDTLTCGIKKSRFARFKHFMKGERPKDQLNLGMWSKHIDHSHYNEKHDLLAVQYKGFNIGTFNNSHEDQVYYITMTRTVAKKQLRKHLLLTSGWMFGPMYGYRKGVPEIGRLTLLPAWRFDLTSRNVGVTLNLFPTNVFSVSTHINLDAFRPSTYKKSNI